MHIENTNWTNFKTILCENLNVNLPLKNSEDIEEAIEYLNSSIQNAAWGSTKQQTLKNVPLNAEIEALIKEKPKVRKSWQNTRDPNVKRKLNRLSKDLKSALCQIENVEMTDYLRGLTATEVTDYSLWKATKKYTVRQILHLL